MFLRQNQYLTFLFQNNISLKVEHLQLIIIYYIDLDRKHSLLF